MTCKIRFPETRVIPVLSQARRSSRTLCSSASPTDVESVVGPKSAGLSERKVRKKPEWRPSEAHRVAATSVHRKETGSAAIKAGLQKFTSPRDLTATPPKRRRRYDRLRASLPLPCPVRLFASSPPPFRLPSKRRCQRSVQTSTRDGLARKRAPRPPGLRRRVLLGGAEDVSGGLELEGTGAVDGARHPRPNGKASVPLVDVGESLVAASAATKKFRELRRLERLVAEGSEEALKAIEATNQTSAPRAASDSSRGGNAEGAGASASFYEAVLPFLLVMAGAIYCVRNGLLPFKPLPAASRPRDSQDQVLGTEGASDGQESTSRRTTVADDEKSASSGGVVLTSAAQRSVDVAGYGTGESTDLGSVWSEWFGWMRRSGVREAEREQGQKSAEGERAESEEASPGAFQHHQHKPLWLQTPRVTSVDRSP